MALPVIDGNGDAANIASILNAGGEHQTTQICKSLALAVLAGEVPGASATVKFGRIMTLDTGEVATAPRDVWPYAKTQAEIPYKTSGAALSIVSDSVNDILAGTGCRTLYLEGLDENWDAQTQTIDMDGTTPVVTTTLWIAVNRAWVVTCGSIDTNEGNISFTHTAEVISYIEAGYGQSGQAVFTTPRNTLTSISGPYIGIIKSGTGRTISINFKTKEFGQGWRNRQYGEAASSGTSYLQAPVSDIPNFAVLGKAQIKSQVFEISTSDTGAYAGWGHLTIPFPQGQ